MSRYTHTLRGQEAEAVLKLPDLSLPAMAVATGTDDRIANGPEQLTPQLTPKSTPTAFPARPGLSANDTVESAKPALAANRNRLSAGELGAERDGSSAFVIAGRELRPEGLEPPTIGSEDRGSIQLSYGRKYGRLRLTQTRPYCISRG